MKRVLSLFIALVLVFSMFAVTAVAFAEGGNGSSGGTTTESRVSFKDEAVAKFKELVFDKHPASIEMSTTFTLDGTVTVDGKEVVWYKDYTLLHTIFPGIRYIELKDAKNVLDKDDDGFDTVTKYSVTYDYNLENLELEADDEGKTPSKPNNPAAKQYQVTEHVELAKAPTVKVIDHEFAGWEISFVAEGKTAEYNDYIFPAGYTFNMPEADVTVKAIWKNTASEESEDIPEVFYSDIVYILYSNSGSREDMKDWERCPVTGKGADTFTIDTKGWWDFRFAIVDGANMAQSEHSLDWDADVLATTFDNVQALMDGGEEDEKVLQANNYTLRSFADDTTHPEIKLSSAMIKKSEEGLTVGTNYSISTALDIEEAGASTTVTYVVYKWVNGEDVLIYDSSKLTDKVTEGYEKNISSTGTITPLEEDVNVKNSYVYKIVYSVVDTNGYFGVDAKATKLEEFNPELKLSVKAKPVTPGKIDAVEAWKIVLYVVAGLSAVGIVVLLFVKPKQTVATADGRYNANANAETAEGSNGKEQVNENDQE